MKCVLVLNSYAIITWEVLSRKQPFEGKFMLTSLLEHHVGKLHSGIGLILSIPVIHFAKYNMKTSINCETTILSKELD